MFLFPLPFSPSHIFPSHSFCFRFPLFILPFPIPFSFILITLLLSRFFHALYSLLFSLLYPFSHLLIPFPFFRFSLRTEPLDITYNPLVIDHVADFFSKDTLNANYMTVERQLKEAAWLRYEELKNQTKAELKHTLGNMMKGVEMVISFFFAIIKHPN